jgi:hypothetical protein
MREPQFFGVGTICSFVIQSTRLGGIGGIPILPDVLPISVDAWILVHAIVNYGLALPERGGE